MNAAGQFFSFKLRNFFYLVGMSPVKLGTQSSVPSPLLSRNAAQNVLPFIFVMSLKSFASSMKRENSTRLMWSISTGSQ